MFSDPIHLTKIKIAAGNALDGGVETPKKLQLYGSEISMNGPYEIIDDNIIYVQDSNGVITATSREILISTSNILKQFKYLKLVPISNYASSSTNNKVVLRQIAFASIKSFYSENSMKCQEMCNDDYMNGGNCRYYSYCAPPNNSWKQLTSMRNVAFSSIILGVNDANACQASCENRMDCSGYTFDSSNSTCYISTDIIYGTSITPPTVVNPLPSLFTSTTGLTCTTAYTTQNDYTIEKCKEACYLNASCRMFSFPSNIKTGTGCLLHNSGETCSPQTGSGFTLYKMNIKDGQSTSNSYLKVNPKMMNTTTLIPFLVNSQCSSTHKLLESQVTSQTQCEQSCINNKNCIFFILSSSSTVGKQTCQICDNILEPSSTQSRVYLVDRTNHPCLGIKSNNCLLSSNCSSYGDFSGKYFGYLTRGIEEAGTGISFCKQKCAKNDSCTDFIHWPKDDSCELCSNSNNLVSVPVNDYTVVYHKNINTRLPLMGDMKNVRVWERVLDPSEISISEKSNLCNEDDCQNTNADLSDEQQSSCGGWDNGNTEWTQYGGKLFFRCSSCSYPTPDTAVANSVWINNGIEVSSEYFSQDSNILVNGHFETSSNPNFNRFEMKINSSLYFSFPNSIQLTKIKIAAGNALNGGNETPKKIQVWVWNSRSKKFVFITNIIYSNDLNEKSVNTAKEFNLNLLMNTTLIKLTPISNILNDNQQTTVVFRQVSFNGIIPEQIDNWISDIIAFQPSTTTTPQSSNLTSIVNGNFHISSIKQNGFQTQIGNAIYFDLKQITLLTRVKLGLGIVNISANMLPKDIQFWGMPTHENQNPELIGTISYLTDKIVDNIEIFVEKEFELVSRKGYSVIKVVPVSNYGEINKKVIFRQFAFAGIPTTLDQGYIAVEGDLKIIPLNENSEFYGRLEVYHNNKWGTISKDGFSSTAANIACKQIGYASGEISNSDCISEISEKTGEPICGRSSQKIWISDITCNGKENSISECPIISWNVRDEVRYSHIRDLIIRCDSTTVVSNLIEFNEGGNNNNENVVTIGTGVLLFNSNSRTDIDDFTPKEYFTGFGRPLPIPSSGKPERDENIIKCSLIRKQRAENVVCVNVKNDERIFLRCVKDYCLTGNDFLAKIDIESAEREEKEKQMIFEENNLIDEEEKREEDENNIEKSNLEQVLNKQTEQDILIQNILYGSSSSSSSSLVSDKPCPP